MTVVIHQPDFLPHLGFFHRFLHADLWVVLDHVQFIHKATNTWHHRDKIKTPRGEQWLSLSVQKCPLGTPINEVLLSTTVDWRSQHLNLLRENYRRAPHFGEIFPYVEELYRGDCLRMVDFNLRSIDMLMRLLGIDIRRVLSSTLGCQGNKTELLIDILRKVQATTYLSGTGARDYLIESAFPPAGIRLVWQEFRHPSYEQLHGPFIPCLSTIDVLFNCGMEGSRKLLRDA